MSGMNSGINVNDPTVVAAFKAALVHQGIIALLIFALLGFAGHHGVVWLPAQTSGGPDACLAVAEPSWQLLRIGFGLLRSSAGTASSLTGLLLAKRSRK